MVHPKRSEKCATVSETGHMPIITLTTDLGTKDHYVGSVKGAIFSQLPDAQIVDITHEIPPFDLLAASYVIRNAYPDFPEGTIHVIGVNPEATMDSQHIVVEYNGHFFIGADTGIFSLIFSQQPQRIFELDLKSDSDNRSFPTKDVFIKAACHLARGGTMEVIGKPIDGYNQRELIRAVTEGDEIRGMVSYIDHYGNIITNISHDLINEVGKGRPFVLYFRREEHMIVDLNKSYNDVDDGERVAMISSTGMLEVGINKGNASKLFGLSFGDTIRIEFR